MSNYNVNNIDVKSLGLTMGRFVCEVNCKHLKLGEVTDKYF
ncbi:hypothetical protein [Isachenkonia alkalipeptolytica]|nr:hypothetical protein [Isachenkonia alkalipeptolytica]